MKINDFMKELEQIVSENGNNCQVVVALSKKHDDSSKSNLHPSMQQALKPFLKFQ